MSGLIFRDRKTQNNVGIPVEEHFANTYGEGWCTKRLKLTISRSEISQYITNTVDCSISCTIICTSTTATYLGTRRFRRQIYWHNGWVKAMSKRLA